MLDPSDSAVIRLSQLLSNLPLHSKEVRNARFRNPQGVAMKFTNFRAVDPNVQGTGLPRVGKKDRRFC
jgi:5-methylcytosine-specific restriction enzyme A